MTQTAQGLRFAPLIRVSTERAEKKGESLRTQTEQIKGYVASLGGTIPAHCWKYSGQEHATPGQERQKLDQLLKDSAKGLFDAVIVCDASRWSRDNLKSKAGLEVLRRNSIRFFVTTMEYDLFNPGQTLFLGMSAEIGEYQAKEQALKSIRNRIARARRGIPTAGKLPYARTFTPDGNGGGTWGLDEEKAAAIRWAASRYLAGESIPVIASSIGMKQWQLWKVLKRRAGDTWELNFDDDRLNVHETVIMKIPAILPPQTIKAIHERTRANKTYTHGEIKHRYLLSRMVFCAECGYTMFGQRKNDRARRYYRHARDRDKPCNPSLWVPAETLERAVLAHLFDMFGDVKGLERAVRRAIPDTAHAKGLIAEKAALEKRLARTRAKKEALVESIADRAITKDEASAQMQKLRDQEASITARVEVINDQLAVMPSAERLRGMVKRMREGVLKAAYKAPGGFAAMSWEDLRALVEHAFAGKDSEGRRLGVYVRKHPDSRWTYEVRGIVGVQVGAVPATLEGAVEYAEDVVGHEEGVNWCSERHAHNC